MRDNMKLLVVGLGSIGQRHVRCLRQLCGDGVELLAFRQRGLDLEITEDLQAREGVSLEKRYGICSFTRLDDALAEGPKAALVCTPNHLHVPVALELARAGLHLFIEKPLSHSWDGVEALGAELDRQGLVCCVGYHLRFHPAVQRIDGMLREGALGPMVGAHFDFGEYMPFWHRYEDYAETFMAKADQGGGVTLTQIHDLDIVYALFGLPETVYSVGGRTGKLKMDAEDHVASVLGYGTDGNRFAVSLTQDCLRDPPIRKYSIDGTEGSLVFDYFKNEISHIKFDSRPEVIYSDDRFKRNDLFLAQMAHFLACVRGEERPRVGLQDGAGSLKIALAIKESLRWQRPATPGT
jgi:predicted dehydrogenase